MLKTKVSLPCFEHSVDTCIVAAADSVQLWMDHFEEEKVSPWFFPIHVHVLTTSGRVVVLLVESALSIVEVSRTPCSSLVPIAFAFFRYAQLFMSYFVVVGTVSKSWVVVS